LRDYWYGFLIYIGIILLLIYGYKKIPYYHTKTKKKATYYISSAILLPLTIVAAIILIRGGNISSATYPIAMSDATLYVKNPSHSSLILSNPFCLIRTIGSKVTYNKYFEEEELNSIFTPTQKVDQTIEREFKIDSSTNIILVILESFGSAHIMPLNGTDHSYTPFLDSLANEGMIMTNAYHNGIRSIDALPALWGSIPTFKTQFLSLPQSVAPMRTLPAILKDMGYTTTFMHGAVRKSMSFVAFAHTSGVDITYSQEEYEAARGTNDFDGTWGIWDDKFLDFAADKIIELKKPFFATLFTLSSHAPFIVPDKFKGKFKGGTLPIHQTIEYTDYTLREFFKKLSKEPFYDNTLFILTADHSSANDIDKYKKVPYSYSIPIILYKPNSNIKGQFTHVASHIDLMPTLLGMMGYKKPFFGYGSDLFGSKANKDRFTLNYFGGAFNIVTDSTTYQFNEKEIISTISSKPIKEPIPPHIYDQAKALIQQYYEHIERRDYIPNENK
ncbi:MAG: LTA synthase family protein, partial [Rikenellaceae bacterium]